MNRNASAIPPGTITLDDLPGAPGPQALTIRLTNHAKRVYLSKLVDLDLLEKIAKFEAQRQEGEATADLQKRIGRQFSIEESGNNVAALLYAMTRYDHPELSFRDLQAAIPFEPLAFAALSERLMDVYGRSMPEPKPKAEAEAKAEANGKPNPTTPAGPKTGGKRSKSNSPSASEN